MPGVEDTQVQVLLLVLPVSNIHMVLATWVDNSLSLLIYFLCFLRLPKPGGREPICFPTKEWRSPSCGQPRVSQPSKRAAQSRR